MSGEKTPEERIRHEASGSAENETTQRKASEIRILVVDDELSVRKGLNLQFQAESGFRIVGEARNGVEAIRLTEQMQPDIVIMDLQMPEMDGLLSTKKLIEIQPQLKIVVLSIRDDLKTQTEALAAGAAAFVAKRDVDSLMRVIRGLAFEI